MEYVEYTVKVFKSSNIRLWYNENRELHREDGPAAEYADGTKAWYKNGKAHREDGPAVESSNGDKSWYLEDVNYTEEEYNKEIARRKNSCDGKVVEIEGKKYKLVEV